MEYKFRSVFDRNQKYTITTDEPLELYDEFSLSIHKIDNDLKSYDTSNIDCILKYMKRGTLDTKYLDLDVENFSGYYMFLETYKQRKCISMGLGIELIKEKPKYEFEGVTRDNADQELLLAFNKYVEESKLLETMFQCYLKGVAHGKLIGKRI